MFCRDRERHVHYFLVFRIKSSPALGNIILLAIQSSQTLVFKTNRSFVISCPHRKPEWDVFLNSIFKEDLNLDLLVFKTAAPEITNPRALSYSTQISAQYPVTQILLGNHNQPKCVLALALVFAWHWLKICHIFV